MKKIFSFSILSFFFSMSLALADDDIVINRCTLQAGVDPIPHTIVVSPSIAYVRYGGDVYFRASAYDTEGKRIEGFEPTSWSATAGLIDEKGWYVANIVGYHTVTANFDCRVLRSGMEEPLLLHVAGTASVNVGNERPR
ncbi:MAG: hypothetical protein HYY61_00425 [Deltaproteobacteria bacterium]|nr:hypothetical protein [Deltaproteobacteria bacterium]